MTAKKALSIGAGIRIGSNFIFAGEVYEVRRGAVPLVKVKPAVAANIRQTHAATIAAHFARIMETQPKTTPAPAGRSPKPELNMKQFGGSPARMVEILRRMGKLPA